jgi:filamentous hemagglutinin family protein
MSSFRVRQACLPTKGKRVGIPAMGVLTASIILGLGFSPQWSYAQALTAAPSQAGNLEITRSPNGVPLVNIVAPNAAGLSHNKYLDYNVGKQGLILNNSKDLIGQSRLGGAIVGNPNLAGTAAAKVILNEVTSQNRSTLAGYTEVHGAAADVIVANPNGITCNGCGFVNTPHATLTTGAPVFGSNGALAGFQVRRGDVRIGADGVDVRNVDVMDIITRTVSIEGATRGTLIRVVAGGQDASYAAANEAITTTPVAGVSRSDVSISSTAVGGMYADRLLILSNDKGAGVAMLGELAANGSELRLQADGKIAFGKLSSTGNVAIATTGAGHDIAAGSISAGGDLAVATVANAQIQTASASKNLQLSVGGDLVAQSLAANSASVQAQSAALGSVQTVAVASITTTTGTLGVERLVSDGAVALRSGSGDISVGRVVSNQDGITLQTAGNVRASADIQSSAGATLSNLAAAKDIRVNAGQSVDINRSVAGATIDLQGHSIYANSVAAKSDIQVNATHDVGLASADTQGALRIISQSGSVGAQSLQSQGDLSVQGAQGVTLGIGNTQGALDIGSDNGATRVLLANSNGATRVVGASVIAGLLQSQQTVQVQSTQGNLVVGNVDALGNIGLHSAADIGYSHVVASGAVTVQSAKDTYTNSASSEGLISGKQGVNATTQGALAATRVLSDGAIQISAKSTDIGTVASAKALQITTADLLKAGAAQGSTVDLKGGSIQIGSADASVGALKVQSKQGDTSLAQATAAGDLTVQAAGALQVSKGAYASGELSLKGISVNAAEAVSGLNYAQSMSTGALVFGSALHDTHIEATGTKANATVGSVAATGNVFLKGDGDVSYSKAISGQNTEVTSTGGNTQMGSTRAMGHLVINTAQTAQLGANALNAKTTGGKAVFDVDGALVVRAKDVNLANSDYQFGGYYVTAVNGIDAKGATLVAKADAARNIQGNVAFKAATITTDAQTSMSADGIMSLAASQGGLTNAGTLQSGSTLELLSFGNITNAGRIVAGGNLVVAGADAQGNLVRNTQVNNQAGASMTARTGDVTLRTQDYNSAGNLVATVGSINMSTGSISASGNMASNTPLRVDADDLVNVTGTLSSAGALALSADRITSTAAAKLQATGDVVLGLLDANGNLQANTSVEGAAAISSSAGNVYARTGTFRNGSIDAAKAVAVRADTISGTGTVRAGQGDIQLQANNSLAVTGNLTAAQTVALLSKAVNNASSTVSGTAVVVARSVGADRKLVSGESFNNGGSIRSNGGDIDAASASIGNTGTIAATRGNVALLGGSTQNSGSISGDNVSLGTSTGDFVSSGQVTAAQLLKVVADAGSVRLSGDMSGGDVQVGAGRDIIVTAATLDAKGSNALQGNLLLKAGGDVQINALQTKTAGGSHQTEEVKKTDWVDGLIHVDRTDTKTTTWTENNYAITSAAAKATNDIAIQAGGNIQVFASDLTSGNGQVYSGKAINLLAGKQGTEKVNQSVHMVAMETGCVLVICQTVKKSDTTDNLADNSAPARVANINGGNAELKSRLDVALQAQQVAVNALNASQAAANAAAQSAKAQALAPETIKAGAVALDGNVAANAAPGAVVTQVGTVGGTAVTLEQVAVNPVAAPNAAASILAGTSQVIPQETRVAYTSAAVYAQSAEFVNRAGYGSYAVTRAQNTTAQNATAIDPLAAAGTTAKSAGVTLLPSSPSPVASLTQGGNIVMLATDGISGQGTQIATSGRVDLSTTNGDIRFTPIEQSSSSIAFDVSRKGDFGGKTELKRTLTETTSWVTGSIAGGEGVSIQANKGAIDLVGTHVVAQNGNVDLGAQSIHIAAVTNTAHVSTSSDISGFLYGKTTQSDATAESTQASQLVAGKNLTVRGTDGVTIAASDLTSGGDTGIYAGYDATGKLVNSAASVNLTAARDKTTASMSSSEAGVGVGSGDNWFSFFGGKEASGDMGSTKARGSSVVAGGNIKVQAGQDIQGEALTMASGGDINLQAGHDVRIDAVAQDAYANSSSSGWSVGVGNLAWNESGRGDISLEMGLKASSATAYSTGVTHQGSTVVAGKNLTVEAGHDVDVIGSKVMAGNDMSVTAKNNINIINTVDSSEMHGTADNLFAGIRLGVSTPISQQIGGILSNGEAAAKAAAAGDTGNAIYLAHLAINNGYGLATTVKGIGESVSSGKGGDVRLATVSIGAKLRADHTETSSGSETVQGSQLGAGGNLALNAGNDVTVQASKVSAGGKLAIDAGNNINIIEGYNTQHAASDKTGVDVEVGVNIGISASLNPTLADVYGRFLVTGEGSNSNAKQAVGSTLTGNAVALNAGHDITARAATIEGAQVALNAKNNINLESAQNTSHANTGGGFLYLGGSVGIGANFMPNSMSVDLAAGVHGSNAESTTQANTHINGSQSVSFTSGGDTNIKGAVIQGGSVTGNVGGNLNVESRQDTASSSKSNIRTDISVGISASPSFSFGLALAGAVADKKWVTEQSGIKASGPVNVNVAGNTNLVGSIINSSAGQTNLKTGGLSFSNLQDYDWGAGGFFNISFGVSLPSGGMPTLSNIPGFGIGFDYRNKQQTTSATVGAGQITVGSAAQSPAGLNRDPGNAQRITVDDKIGFAFGF